jgi:hypothetical protein
MGIEHFGGPVTEGTGGAFIGTGCLQLTPVLSQCLWFNLPFLVRGQLG